MKTESADSRMPEPPPQDPGIPEGLKTSPLNTETLGEFAQNMSEHILRSVFSQKETVEPEESIYNQEHEMLAEALASAVIEIALSEVCRGRNLKDHMEGAEIEMENNKGERQCFEDKSRRDQEHQTCTQPCHPPLSQSGLPAVGSLDYPDAPPTTPLLPELERSRSSFARKLKGGLAKVFLPSPPPPTPKDKEDNGDALINDPHVELMEHLMQSLSTDDLGRGSFEVAPLHEPTIETFAQALSCDITKWVLAAKKREQMSHDSDLNLLAQQLAETIITSSIDEAKVLI